MIGTLFEPLTDDNDCEWPYNNAGLLGSQIGISEAALLNTKRVVLSIFLFLAFCP
jgi:hypothetical protein